MGFKYKITMAWLICLSLFACREDDPAVFNPEDELGFNSWSEVFESYWNGMNYSYAFWDIDSTDWDQVYREYKPRFEGLEFKNAEDSLKVKELFEEIVGNLIDHHYGLTLFDENGNTWFNVRPGLLEIQKRDYYHKSLSISDYKAMIKHNVEIGRLTKGAIYWNESDSLLVCSCCIDNSIAYLRLSSFSLIEHLGEKELQETMENYYDLINNLEGLKGIIIDTRCNGGGYLNDLYYILNPLIKEKFTFGYSRSKNGMGRLDYTPWSPITLYPIELDEEDEDQGSWITRDLKDTPIVSLVDIFSISMGEVTAMAISEMPNGYVVGERTFGAHGPLDADFNSSYTGTFSNSAFSVKTSTSMIKRLDGKSYEEIGIIPDVEALYNEAEFKKGNDTQLEVAVQLINSLVR